MRLGSSRAVPRAVPTLQTRGRAAGGAALRRRERRHGSRQIMLPARRPGAPLGGPLTACSSVSRGAVVEASAGGRRFRRYCRRATPRRRQPCTSCGQAAGRAIAPERLQELHEPSGRVQGARRGDGSGWPSAELTRWPNAASRQCSLLLELEARVDRGGSEGEGGRRPGAAYPQERPSSFLS